MTPQAELVIRAKTLHRRAWLDRTSDDAAFGVFNDDLTVGPVTIKRAAGAWIVMLREGSCETIVYYEPLTGDVSVEKDCLKQALKHLRERMILDDLARI